MKNRFQNLPFKFNLQRYTVFIGEKLVMPPWAYVNTEGTAAPVKPTH
jgi:hypothetical protein